MIDLCGLEWEGGDRPMRFSEKLSLMESSIKVRVLFMKLNETDGWDKCADVFIRRHLRYN